MHRNWVSATGYSRSAHPCLIGVVPKTNLSHVQLLGNVPFSWQHMTSLVRLACFYGTSSWGPIRNSSQRFHCLDRRLAVSYKQGRVTERQR